MLEIMVAMKEPAANKVRLLRRAEYEHLVEAGFFSDEKIELLYGRLVRMSPQGREHAYAIKILTRILRAVGDRADVLVQLPFAVGDLSEPEPDVAVVPLHEPTHPSNAILIIEVAQTSLKDDRDKAAIYAAAAVPEYWIINLNDNVVERYSALKNNAYTVVTTHGRNESLSVPSFDDVVVRVDELMLP